MRAITIWQPYASLIALGFKRVETRSWGTPYRGQVAIHAAGRKEGLEDAWDEVNDILNIYGQPPLTGKLPLGAIIAVAELVACVESRGHADGRFGAVEHELGNLGPGRWAWCLDKVQPLDAPIRVRGQQGLWNVPIPCEDRVLAMLRPIVVTPVVTNRQTTLF